MRSTHLKFVLGSFSAAAVLWSGAVRGQDLDAAAIHYGDGVHAYFAGNSSRAEQSLSSALELNSQDPRIYYFRALSLLRQGRTAEARGDMQVGAALEAQRPGRFAIGSALERVQGHDRLLLEQFRRQARSEARSNGASRGQNPPGIQPDALRQRVVIPLEEYLRPGAPRPAARGAVDAALPRTFAPTQQTPPAPANRQSPAETPGDPFQDDPQTPDAKTPVAPPPPTSPPPSATTPADSGDPFEGSATESAPAPTNSPASSAPPAEAPPDSSDGDPFGTP
jgi:hypothetical protein